MTAKMVGDGSQYADVFPDAGTNSVYVTPNISTNGFGSFTFMTTRLERRRRFFKRLP